MNKTVCVFCGSRLGADPKFEQLAEEMGTAIGKNGLNMVFGGGGTGLMGTVSQAAIKAGARVTGIIPELLMHTERPELNLTKLIIVPDMPTRKALMEEKADYFVILPGGIGTLEEAFEVMTCNWLNIFDKPVGFLNVNHYYDPLFKFLENAQAQGFVSENAGYLWTHSEDPEELLSKLMEQKK